MKKGVTNKNICKTVSLVKKPAISKGPYAISSSKPWYRFLVSDKITIFRTGEAVRRLYHFHNTFWTLTAPILQ